MDSNTVTAGIDVIIDPTRATIGERQAIQSLDRIITHGQRLSAANDNLGNSFNRLGQNVGGVRRSVGPLDEAMGALSDTVRTIAFGAATAGALSLTGAFVASTKAASDYADVLARISTNVDTATFNMKGLSEGILEQSAAFGGMPVQTANAAYDIISAGADSASEALTTLTAANKLAVGGITTVGVAADGLTSVLNAYAARGLTAAQASDAMFISARDGKTSIEDLSSNLGQVAPLAATIGVSFDEVTGALAVLTKGGIKTSESVTGVKAILSSIIKPSDEAAKLAKKLGIEFNSVALATTGLRGVLQDVAAKTKGSSEAMAVLYGGTEALVPALALTADKGREFATTMENMASKAGATELAVKKMMEGSPGLQWQRVLASANVEMTKLGTSVSQAALPALRFLADNMGTIVSVIELALIPLSVRLVGLWGTAMVQSIVTLGATAVMRFASMSAAQGVLAASTATLSGALNGMLGLVGGPLGLAIGAAAVGIYTLASNSSQARAVVDELADSATKTASSASDTHTQSLLAARGVSTFGGEAGAAAQQLWGMASAAKAAAIETAKLNYTKAKTTFDTAYGQTTGGIKRRAGSAWKELQDPNQTVGDAARSTGALTQAGWDYLWRPSDKKAMAATQQAYNQAQEAWRTLQDVRNGKEENYLPNKVTPGAPFQKDSTDKKKGKTDAERLAERIDDWWKKLDGDSKDAEATYKALSAAADAGENLSIASADTAKQLEIQRLAGHDITAQEKDRIATALQNGRNAKFLSDELLAAEQRKYDLQIEQALLDKKRAGLTEGQLEVERGVLKFRSEAQKTGLDLQSSTYKLAETKLRTDLASKDAIEAQNRAYDEQKEKLKALVDQGKSVLAEFSPGAALTGQLDELTKKRDAADAYYKDTQTKYGTELTKLFGVEKAYQDTIKGISRAASEATTQFKTRWFDAIDVIASNFTGKVGDAINGIADALYRFRTQGTDRDVTLAGGLAGLLGGKALTSYRQEATDKNGGLLDALKNPMKSMSDGFKDFKKLFTDPGQGGFAASLGKGLARAGAGMQMGSAADSLVRAFGGKGSRTGSAIGGALGGAVGGPIGGFLGGTVGSLVGGLFKKTAKSQATITGLGDAQLSGTSADRRDAASGMAGGVQKQLSQLATELGATVGSFRVSIGTYKDKIRVNANGGAIGGVKGSGAISYASEAEAIAAAVEFAVKQGALQGLGDLEGKLVKAFSLDAALAVIKDWRAAMDDFAAMTDPVTAAVQSVSKSLDALRGNMVKVGATTTDLIKLDEYRAAKLKQVLKDQVSGFQDILNQLNGDAGGVSSYNQLNDSLRKLDTFRADIAAGKQVDQAAFTDLAGQIISKAGEVYGINTKDYQDIAALLRTTTTGAMDSATTAFNKAAGNGDVVKAVSAQTDAYTANQNTMIAQQGRMEALMKENIELQKQIKAALTGSGVGGLSAEGAKVNTDW